MFSMSNSISLDLDILLYVKNNLRIHNLKSEFKVYILRILESPVPIDVNHMELDADIIQIF